VKTSTLVGIENMKPFESIGIWWLPENDKEVITGTLSFSFERGLRLELLGSFSEMEDALKSVSSDEYNIFPRILGVLKDGKDGDFVTLVGCTEIDPGISNRPIRVEKFVCRIGYLGRRHLLSENILFQKIIVETEYLMDWTAQTGFIQSLPRDITQQDISFVLPPPIPVTSGDISLAIDFGFQSNRSIRTQTISEQASAIFESHTPSDFEIFWLKYVSAIQDFLTFATGHPSGITQVTGYIADDILDESVPSIQNDYRGYFHIIYIPSYYQKNSKTKYVSHECVFNLPELAKMSKSLEHVWNSWLSIRTELVDVMNLYFGTRYNPPVFRELHFLVLAQAIEVYCRIRDKRSTVVSKETFNKVRDDLLQIVPKDKEYEWLQIRIRELNQARLYQMVETLIEEHNYLTQLFQIDNADLARLVTDTRNYYTHFSDKKRHATGADLYYLSEILSYLLLSCLLKELGFTVFEIQELLKKNLRFKYKVQEIRSEFRIGKEV
jgi:hypothetical protein